MINIFFEEVDEFEIDSKILISWLNDTCKNESKNLEEVNLIFCSDDYLLQMNTEFLEHDYYTDIITFDYCVGDTILGDLFISVDRVKDNAVIHKVDFYNELDRVIVHGVLHLCGYKDKSKDEAKIMREKEDYYLSKNVPRETL